MIRSMFRRFGLFLVSMLSVATVHDRLSAQEEYRSDEYVVRRIPCWTTVMEFYDRRAFPYYSVDGYFFDANPFQTTRMMDGNTSMIMRSAKGYSLIDVTGAYRWTDARIRVDCFARDYIVLSVPYAIVRYELGSVERVSTACASDPEDPWGGEHLTEIASEAYDPFDPDQALPADCGGGSEEGASGTGDGMNCWQEYIVIEISYDGGLTWQEFWAGWGTVCEQNEA